MKIGAQLFTVRDFTKTLDDFAETLKKIADIGYTTVQVSGTCPFEAEWLRDRLKETGLTCAITHTNPDRVINETEAVIREHDIFGCDYIGIGSLPGSLWGNPGALPAFAELLAVPARNSCTTTTALSSRKQTASPS